MSKATRTDTKSPAPRAADNHAALDAERELDTEELDRLATASYMTGRDEEGFGYWARGHRRCLDAGEVAKAARFGVRLAQGLAFKGDIARSRGWVERSRRLLDDAGLDCVERGFLDPPRVCPARARHVGRACGRVHTNPGCDGRTPAPRTTGE
jgi:hypothetical protein